MSAIRICIAPRTLLAVLVAGGVLASCPECPAPAPATACQRHEQCPAGYYCDPARGFCMANADGAVVADAGGRLDTARPDTPQDAALPDTPRDAASDGPRSEAGAPFVPDLVAVGRNHVCAAASGAGLKCWGKASYGQLGYGDEVQRGDDPGEMGAQLPAVEFAGALHIVALSAGDDHTCALLASGAVTCWGDNSLGQLGVGDTIDRGDDPGEMAALPTVDLGGAQVAALASGDDFNCVLIEGGSVRCWGGNPNGQLCLGDTIARGNGTGALDTAASNAQLGDFVVASIALGPWHACALSDNGQIKCWGYNAFGQLGYGDDLSRGGTAESVGNLLPAVPLPTETSTAVVQIAAGEDFTCARWADGAVRCWGSGGNGQLGLGNTATHASVADLLPIDLSGPAQHIVAGENHVCALLASGSLQCWGYANYGQLGYGDVEDRGNDSGEMGAALPLVDVGGSIRSIASYDHVNCTVLTDGRLKCWGINDYGQLGLGDLFNRGEADNEMGSNLPTIDLGRL